MRAVAAAVLLLAGAAGAEPDTRSAPEAIAAGLAWLARHQQDDGRWSSSADAGHDLRLLYEPDAAREADVLVTAAALLAFLGDGHTPWEGAWRESAARAHAWLAARADDGDGRLATLPDAAAAATLAERERLRRRAALARQNQLWGTLALLETAAAADGRHRPDTLDRESRERRLAAALHPARAALLAVLRDDAFLSETAATMDDVALLAAVVCAARGAGLAADPGFAAAVAALQTRIMTGWTEKVVPYRFSDGGEIWFAGAASTAQAIAAGAWLRSRGSWRQWSDLAPGLLARPPVWNPHFAVEHPAAHAPERTAPAGTAVLPPALARIAAPWRDDIANEYAWFWQAAAFRLFPVPESAAWRSSFERVALAHQRRGGGEAGSWDPSGPHARVFGREAGVSWMVGALEGGGVLRVHAARWEEKKQDRPIVPVWTWTKPEPVDCRVCGLRVLTTTMFSKAVAGKTAYFCSRECLERFEVEPGRWDKQR